MKRQTKRRITAAERRICALAPDAPTLDEAVKQVMAEVNNHRLEGGGFKGCQLEIDCRREEARHPGSLCTPLPSRPLCFLNSPPDILGPRSAGPKTSSSGEQTPEGVLGSLFLLPLHDRTQVLVWSVGYEHVDVVACNLTRDYVQLMFHRDLTNQIAHTNRYWTDQNLFTIFRVSKRCALLGPFSCALRACSDARDHNTTIFSSPKGEGFRPSPEETLMQGVACPPTDLEDIARKIGVREISYESFPGSGELHKKKSGYRIVCSSDQPHSRQRFTVAHELAHVILERTGRNAPRTGRSVERVCDMLAAECLMPTSVFEAGLPTTLALSDIEHLSRVFDTSIPATAIRCTHFRRVCIFGVTGDRVTWGCGGIRRGAVMSLVDEVRDGVRSVMAGKQPEENVYFYDNGYRGGYHRFEWIHMGPEQYHDLLFA